MPVSGLSATTDYVRPAGRRAPERRAAPDRPGREPPPEPTADPAPIDHASDAAFYASRFKADISRLREPGAAPEADGDASLFDFFGNLSALLVAVRSGDIERARAAANALEMEVLIERSAGRRAAAPAPEDCAIPPHGAEFRDALLRLPVERLVVRPRALVRDPDDGGAAYETLTHYLDGDPAVR